MFFLSSVLLFPALLVANSTHKVLTLLYVIAGATVFALAASFMVTKAASKSPLWNIGFGVVVAVLAASLLFGSVIVVVRRLFPNL